MGNGAGLVLLGAGAVVMLVVFAFIGLATRWNAAPPAA
jgi:hypothetical protein